LLAGISAIRLWTGFALLAKIVILKKGGEKGRRGLRIQFVGSEELGVLVSLL